MAGSNPTAFQAVSFQQVSPLSGGLTWRAHSCVPYRDYLDTRLPRRSACATIFRRLSVAANPTSFEPVAVLG